MFHWCMICIVLYKYRRLGRLNITKDAVNASYFEAIINFIYGEKSLVKFVFVQVRRQIYQMESGFLNML